MEKCCHVDGNTFCQTLGRSCYGDKPPLPKQEVFETSSNSGKNVDGLYERIAGATGLP